MSFREKTAWLAILLTLAIWGHYFFRVWQSYAGGTLGGEDGVLQLFLLCLGATIVLLLGLTLVSARLGQHRFGADLDERERQVESRARRVEIVLLELGALAVAAASPWLSGSVAASFPAAAPAAIGIVLANLILFVVLAAQVLHEVTLIVQFRMMD